MGGNGPPVRCRSLRLAVLHWFAWYVVCEATANGSATLCGLGHYKDARVQSCSPCAPGSFMNETAHDLEVCYHCAPGNYSFMSAMSQCWPCPEKAYSARGADTCILNVSCDPCIDRPSLRVRAVLGSSSNPFWLTLARAMNTAAVQLKIDFRVHMQLRQSTENHAALIDSIMENESPDLLLTYIPGALVEEAVRAAVQRVPVVSFNSGGTVFSQVGSWGHISADERLGGLRAVGELQKAFGSTPLRACTFVVHTVGNSALDQRRDGFRAGCEALNLAWLGVVIVPFDDVDGHYEGITQAISSYLASDYAQSGGLALLLAGSGFAKGGVRAYVDAGYPALVKMGTFDLGADGLEGLQNGALVFGIDQQPWMQGYLSVVIGTLYASTGNVMATKLFPTGPAFVTEAPSAEQSLQSGEAFPVCDCPWKGGRELLLTCGSEDGFDPIGECPLESSTGCSAPCRDYRLFKLRGIVHGSEDDAFWRTLKAGAEQAANDLRLIDFTLDLWPTSFGGGASRDGDLFSQDLFEEAVREAADSSLDGIVVSLPGEYASDTLAYAASKTRVVTVASGHDISEGLTSDGGLLLAHVGMHEVNAGSAAAQKLVNAGASHLAVVSPGGEESALAARWQGAQDTMLGLGLNASYLDLELAGVSTANMVEVTGHLTALLVASPEADGVLLLDVALVPAARAAMAAVPRRFAAAGSFGSSEDLLQAIEEGAFFVFGVDPQPYVQGYMAVVLLHVHWLTGQKFAQHIIESGPYFITAREPGKEMCSVTKWTRELVGSHSLFPSVDGNSTAGFPVCEYTGNCEDPTFYFNTSVAECLPCSPGRFKNETMSACVICPAGTSTNGESRARQCTLCPAGKFSEAGDADCRFCARGTFQGEVGQPACTFCDQPLTTVDIAQTSNSSCVCPAGTFMDADKQCRPCPSAMVCAIGSDIKHFSQDTGGEYPIVEPGFMTLAERPLEAYLCQHKGRCPGGAPGSCATKRDTSAVACGLCIEDTHETGDKCAKCDGAGASVPLLLFCFVSVALVVLLTLGMNKNVLKQSMSILMAILMFGLLVTALQIISVLDDLALGWDELGPLRSIFKFMQLFTFNLGILQAECIMGNNAVVAYVVRQLVVPLGIAIVVIVIAVKKAVRPGRTDVVVEFTNSVGTIFNIFFISVMISAASPFMCYDHPTHPSGSKRSSMTMSPSVFCFEGSTHAGMLIVGLMAFFLVPMPFLAASTHFNFQYPSYVRRHKARMLAAFRFLYFRYHPQSYYYGSVLLARNAAIALVPAILRDKAMHVLTIATILLVYLLVQQEWHPWRVKAANVAEGITMVLLTLLLLAGAMATEMSASVDSVTAVAVIALLIAIVILIAGVAYGVYSWFHRKPFYHFFICHHKSAAAAQARLLQMLIEQSDTSKNVFIDSDDLKELDKLFEVVKIHIGTLVVFLTKDTLTRPWCCGEIVTAVASPQVKLIAARHASFEEPTAQQLASLDLYVDFSSCSLTEYGMTFDEIRNAFMQLLGDGTPAVSPLPAGSKGSLRLEPILEACLGRSRSSVARSRLATLPTQENMLLISCDAYDDEAVASSGVLFMKISQEIDRMLETGMCRLCDCDETNLPELQSLAGKSRFVLVLLSQHSLVCEAQVEVILAAVAGIRSCAIPVTLPTFAFPMEDYYVQRLPKLRLSEGSPEDERRQLLRGFFKIIAIALATHASDRVLRVQAEEVVHRVRHNRQASTNLIRPSNSTTSGVPVQVSPTGSNLSPSWRSLRMKSPLSRSVTEPTPTSHVASDAMRAAASSAVSSEQMMAFEFEC